MAAPTDEDIEEAVLAYAKDPFLNEGTPSRGSCIRYVTGVMPVLPSAVAKVITRLIEAGRLAHATQDRLIFKN